MLEALLPRLKPEQQGEQRPAGGGSPSRNATL